MNARGVGRWLLIDACLLCAWGASLGAVLLHEHGMLWGGFGNPSATMAAPLEAEEQWFGIYYQGWKVGFSHVSLVPDERDGVPGVSIRDMGRLAFTLMGQPQQVEVRAWTFIDANWRLQHFQAELQAPAYRLQWVGRRQGDELVVSVSTPESTITKRLRDPVGSTLVTGLSSWTAFHRLKVGQSGKAWIFNPLALNPELVYFTVRSREVVDGREAMVVETDVSGMSATSWVTPEGEVLKETSPLGWEVRREPQTQAWASVERAPQLDLLLATAVPVDRPLGDVRQIEELTLLVVGVEEADLNLQRSWQQVLLRRHLAEFGQPPPQDDAWCLIRLRRPSLSVTQQGPIPAGIRPYLHPSPFVQADDARIIAKAKEIIGRRTDPWEQVQALSDWVHRTLAKHLTIGLPSAVDVLLAPAGDCHEHTVLFTALARSAGLPTRMIAGLVYQAGAFYYHAWPEVWLGAWIPIDPTLGQPLADVTHVGLIEAESESLISLGRFMGKLRLQVLALRKPQGQQMP